MNDTAAQPEAAPAEGQGAESGNGNDLYQAFLEGVPEDIHDQLIPALKAQDAEFTKKFQSRAEQMKPFEELGIFDRDPGEIGQYLQLDQAMQAAQEGDEQAIEAVYQWWDQVGDALKFYDEDGEEAEAGEEEGNFDLLDMDQKAFQDAIRKQIEEAVGPLAEQFQTQQQREAEAAAEQEINQTIDGWVSEIKEANPEVFAGDDGDAVLDEVLELAVMFSDAENPVAAGFEKYQSLVGKGEAGLFERKQNQTPAPQGSGRPNTTPRAVSMKDAKSAALEYLHNGNQMKP